MSHEKQAHPSEYRIIAGLTDIEARGAQALIVSYFIPHSGYTSVVKRNDIAMVFLDKSLVFSSSVRKVVMATPRAFSHYEPWQLYGPDDCHALGWGHLAWKGSRTKTLHKVILPLISNEKCQDKLQRGSYVVWPNQLCTLMEGVPRDTCQGDSGGPLVCKGLQVGIVSFGKRCAEKDFPAFWTRVDKYFHWIYRIMTMSNDTLSVEHFFEGRSGVCGKFDTCFCSFLPFFWFFGLFFNKNRL